jgi:hypothetical protein
MANLDILLCQLIRDVVRLPDRECDDGQCRILGCSGGELASVRDKEILNVMGLTPFVANAVLGTCALANRYRGYVWKDKAAFG